MKKNMIIAAVAAFALPVAAFAAEGEGLQFGADNSNMNYTFAEFGFTDVDVADGFGIEGSYQYNEKLFVFGSFDSLSGDGYDSTNLSVGVGSSMALNDKFDAYGKFGFVMSDIELDFGPGFGSASDDDTGFGLEVGVRGEVAPQVEVFGNFQYIGTFDNSTGFELGGRYWLQDNLGVSIAFIDIEDTDGFTLAARYEF